MELEQRVKVLEQEVKLLKNEVQATLLDIQEQLLSSRYPALRTEAAHQPEGAHAPAATSASVAEASGNNGRPVKSASLRVSLPESSYNTETRLTPSLPPTPVVGGADTHKQSPKSVAPPVAVSKAVDGNRQPAKPTSFPAASSNDNPSVKPTPVPMPGLLNPKTDTASDKPMDWEMLSKQTAWTIQTVQKLGPERTSLLIEMYTEKGLLPKMVGATLQQVALTFQPDSVPANGEKELTPTPAERTGRQGTLDKSQRNIIVRIIHHLQSLGSKPEAPHG